MSLVPLRDLLTILAGGPLTVTVQVVGNLLALAAGCSVLAEAAQYILRLDPVSSVDEILLNTAGVAPLVVRYAGASSDRPRSAPVPGR